MPIPLRPGFGALISAPRLRRPVPARRGAARASQDAGQARRLLALAAIHAGDTRTQDAAIGGVTRPVIRDWVVRFNAPGPDGLIGCKAPGQSLRLAHEQRAALVDMAC